MDQQDDKLPKSKSNVASTSDETSEQTSDADPATTSDVKVPSKEPSKIDSKGPSKPPSNSKVPSKLPSDSKVPSKPPSKEPSQAEDLTSASQITKDGTETTTKTESKPPSKESSQTKELKSTPQIPESGTETAVEIQSKSPSKESSQTEGFKSASKIPEDGTDKVETTSSNADPSLPSKKTEEAGETTGSLSKDEEVEKPSPTDNVDATASKVQSTKSMMPEDGNMIGEKDGDWILEKMGYEVAGINGGKGSRGGKGNRGGKGSKGGQQGTDKRGGKCSMGPEDPTSHDPDRLEGWVLEKLYRQTGPPCNADKSMVSVSSKASTNANNVSGEAVEEDSSSLQLSQGNQGPRYVNLEEESNLYENDGNWKLEKMRTGSGTTMGFASMMKTNREKLGVDGTGIAGSNGSGTCSDSASGYTKSACFDNKRVCQLARKCMVVYDTLTSCDIMGPNECDLTDDEGESVWGWITGVLDELFADDPSQSGANGSEADGSEAENNNCS